MAKKTESQAIIWGATQPRHIDAIQPAPELMAVQDLMPIAPEDRDRLRADIEKNGIREPLHGYIENGVFFYLAGHNRATIARDLYSEGRKEFESIPIRTPQGDATTGKRNPGLDTAEERRAFAIADNLNRRHLTTAQKRNLITHLLTAAPHKSDRQHAKTAGVSDKTVTKIRADLVGRAEIPNVETRTDSKGRQQQATKPIKTGHQTRNKGPKQAPSAGGGVMSPQNEKTPQRGGKGPFLRLLGKAEAKSANLTSKSKATREGQAKALLSELQLIAATEEAATAADLKAISEMLKIILGAI